MCDPEPGVPARVPWKVLGALGAVALGMYVAARAVPFVVAVVAVEGVLAALGITVLVRLLRPRRAARPARVHAEVQRTNRANTPARRAVTCELTKPPDALPVPPRAIEGVVVENQREEEPWKVTVSAMGRARGTVR